MSWRYQSKKGNTETCSSMRDSWPFPIIGNILQGKKGPSKLEFARRQGKIRPVIQKGTIICNYYMNETLLPVRIKVHFFENNMSIAFERNNKNPTSSFSRLWSRRDWDIHRLLANHVRLRNSRQLPRRRKNRRDIGFPFFPSPCPGIRKRHIGCRFLRCRSQIEARPSSPSPAFPSTLSFRCVSAHRHNQIKFASFGKTGSAVRALPFFQFPLSSLFLLSGIRIP